MTINDILQEYKLSKRELSEEFGIPYSTLLKWCFDTDNPNYRKCPDYIVNMINTILEAKRK